MASLIQYPASLSLSGNLNKVIISASESVRFTLLKGATTVLDERYRAIGGMVEIDISSVVSALLSLSIPTTDVFQQSGIYADFTIQLDGVTAATFRCIRAGVDAESINATTFLAANFLTWQPQTKRVRRLGPEYLTYYFTQAASVKVRYYTANSNTVVTLHSAAAGTCYTYNMQMQHLLSLSGAPANAYGIIDVWVETSGGTRLSYVQRYVYSPQEKEDRHFLFENSVGGLDGVTFSGSETVTVNNDYDAAEYQERLVQIPGDISTRHRQRTGQLTPVEARWIRDLFTSQRVYATDGSTVRLIVITEADTGDDSDENIKSLSFTWRPTDDRGLQNAVRTTDALPNSLPIQIPDSELFFLEARLVDLPEGRLDPTTLIPIQSPFAENWSRITWGALHDTLMGEVNDNITTALQVLNSYVLKSEWEADKEAIYEYIAALAGEISELPWDSLDETEAILSSGLAKAYARLTSLEDWLREPSFDELAAHSVCSEEITTRKIWLTEETYLETDENGDIHINAGLWSDSFLTAGGQGDGGGGGGGGGLDLGLMWSSLTNTTIATADVTSATSINPSHLPAWSVQGTDITGSVVTAYNSETHAATAVLSLALATTGVTAGTYNSVTVDQYGRVTAGSSSANDDLEEITAAGIAMLAARVSSLEDWLRDPAFDEVAVSMFNVADVNFGRLLRNDELEHNKVTIAGLEVALGGTISLTDLEGVLGTTPLVGGLATVSARVASLEDWLRNPALDTLEVYDLCAGRGAFREAAYMYSTLDVTGLVTFAGTAKLTGTTKKIWFGDSIYIELDSNGYLHTNAGFYSESFITSGGLGSGGSGSGVDLGSVWSSLTNTTMATTDVTNSTHINPSHIPAITISGGSYYQGTTTTDWNATTRQGTITIALLPKTTGVVAGTYTSVTVDQYGRVTAGTDAEGGSVDASITGGIASNAARIASLEDWLRDPALDELAVGTLNARSLNLGTKIANDLLEHDGVTIASTLVHLGGEMSKNQLRSLLEINNVENTKLSTWAGTTNITVLGTVATGVWHGTAITNDYIASPRVRINGTWVYLGDSYSTGAISPGTAGGSADTSGVSFAVPYVTMSSYGIVTGYGTHTHSISGSQLVSAIGNNYVNNASYATNAGNATNATYATYDEDQYRFRVYYAGSLVVDSGLKLKSRNGSTLSTISSTDLVSAIGNSAVNRATGDESGNRILTGYGATLSAASNALKLLSMSGATLSTITAANLVTVLGTTPVNRATADANGNNIASSYLSTTGGTIAGDLRLQSGNYGQHLYFGDGAFCYIHEDTDDHMMLYGDKGITMSTRSGYGVTVTYDMTVNGKLYITSNAYLEYSSSNAGIHFSKGLYSDYYITSGSSSSSSDARMKTNMEDVQLTVAQIAAAPAVTFDWIEEWRGKGAGSIAQYWQPILPYNVKRWDGDLLSMEYGNIALLSAITVAREVVSQGRKINSLDNRLKVVERKLSIN